MKWIANKSLQFNQGSSKPQTARTFSLLRDQSSEACCLYSHQGTKGAASVVLWHRHTSRPLAVPAGQHWQAEFMQWQTGVQAAVKTHSANKQSDTNRWINNQTKQRERDTYCTDIGSQTNRQTGRQTTRHGQGPANHTELRGHTPANQEPLHYRGIHRTLTITETQCCRTLHGTRYWALEETQEALLSTTGSTVKHLVRHKTEGGQRSHWRVRGVIGSMQTVCRVAERVLSGFLSSSKPKTTPWWIHYSVLRSVWQKTEEKKTL